jgi:hypothetical protein
MAVPAKLEPDQRFPEDCGVPMRDRPACVHAAKLYGLGYDRKSISQVIANLLYGDKEIPMESRVKSARQRLRSWESRQWFRDMVWDQAVVELDMAGPQILRGIARKAKRGRVDAAKLALGITGRYKEKDDNTPSAVTINIATISRPQRQAVEAGDQAIEIVAEED